MVLYAPNVELDVELLETPGVLNIELDVVLDTAGAPNVEFVALVEEGVIVVTLSDLFLDIAGKS